MTIRHVNFVSIAVTDQDRALAFYRDKLGLTVQTDAAYADDWRWIFLEIPGSVTKIQFSRPNEISVPEGHPALALISDDVDVDVASLKKSGVTIVDGPTEAPWHSGVRYALIEDSEGNTVLLQSSIHQGA